MHPLGRQDAPVRTASAPVRTAKCDLISIGTTQARLEDKAMEGNTIRRHFRIELRSKVASGA